MILMRMAHVKGMCEIVGYDKDKWELGGWFPLSSISLTTPRGEEDNQEDSKKKQNEVSVTKSVDGGSVHLMMQAVYARERNKEEHPLRDNEIEIHFVGSLAGQSSESGVFTFLMLHLEETYITSWQVSGSGDDRPTENFTIGYERMAMAYYGTVDGKVQDQAEINGWQQGRDADSLAWTPGDLEFFPIYPARMGGDQ